MELAPLASGASPADLMPYILLYVGPDVFLPLMSAAAAVVGALLLFWQRSMAVLKAAWRVVLRRGPAAEPAPPVPEPRDGRP